MTEAEVDGTAVVVEAAPLAHAPRAKAKQKTPQQKSALEEVFASTLLLFCFAAGSCLWPLLTV